MGLFRRQCIRKLPIQCWFKGIIIIIMREMKLIFSGQRDFFENVVPNKDRKFFEYKPVFYDYNA